ncbi:uncharacterized protein LY89DRAFT_689544 [Mollisia scopiformis]|uniref:Uncharacterized protein n=1 Tax=Mollisia scopiformis TaxID=149040 RepID=A0A132BDC4_MOLSC|nr:uncharacterized protein LY89DRAFT_689544 [Mollisia scopiformis]KUJ10253.1 hypothetical protein LY89DRAFT_689544 [Mollisia scopiformis]
MRLASSLERREFFARQVLCIWAVFYYVARPVKTRRPSHHIASANSHYGAFLNLKIDMPILGETASPERHLSC